MTEGRCDSAELNLDQSPASRLTTAALEFSQGKYESAIEIYRELLSESPDLTALHFYIAVCYSYLELHEKATESLLVYLERIPESLCAITLHACNVFKLQGPKPALEILNTIRQAAAEKETAMAQHNRAVFERDPHGDKIWRSLTSVLPEAATNLVLHSLAFGPPDEMAEILTSFKPVSAIDYAAKGMANAVLWQQSGSERNEMCARYLVEAKQWLEMVGQSENERDTILGRQCMAVYSMLKRQYDDALVFLESIRDYVNDSAFKWNHAVCLVERGDYCAAQAQLESMVDNDLKSEISYGSLLARCYVENGNAEAAWQLYLANEEKLYGLDLLEEIADLCYLRGAFRVAARSFDLLERINPSPQTWNAKRGAILGALRDVVLRDRSPEVIEELLQYLSDDDRTESGQIREIVLQWSTN